MLFPALELQFPWRLLPHPLANPEPSPQLDWSLSFLNFLKDKFPKPPANWTVVSKNQFSNNRKKYQPLRQSPPRLSQAIAANVAAAEAGGARTKARAFSLL